jgi:hypothetical protein
MMMIQTPGGILMVTSIVLRPGTNWTSEFSSLSTAASDISFGVVCIGWISFAAAAILQGCLLTMCIFWKIRQRKLNIDDFGKPLGSGPLPYTSDAWRTPGVPDQHYILVEDPEAIQGSSENPVAVRLSLANVLESAADGIVPSPPPNGLGSEVDEEAPLLQRREVDPDSEFLGKRGWSAWFGR